MQDPPADLEEAGVYRSRKEVFEHGLVALAIGEPYWLMPEGECFRLMVEPGAGRRVREELVCYDRECASWPAPGTDRPHAPLELGMPALWAAATSLVFLLQASFPGRLEAWGDLDSSAVFDRHESWRIATSLFLHADAGHLTSNLIFGILAFAAVLSSAGRWRGWLLILASSLTGNLAVAALFYPGPYRSLGASTAIFAAMGLLTGRVVGLPARDPSAQTWQEVFMPLAAGASILGLFGAGGLEVDVAAHASGFLSGLAWGFVDAALSARTRPRA